MLRILFTYIVPLLAPLAFYLAWTHFARQRARKTGADLPSIERGPVFWSLVTGFALMIATLVTLALTTGDPPDSGKYVSPRFEDGRIVPPIFKQE